MKNINTLFVCLLACFVYTTSFAQTTEDTPDTPEEEKRTIKEVDQINQASDEINETVANTNVALKSTVENSKEAINTLGSIFKSDKKDKKNKSKGSITITVQQIAYDSDELSALYEKIAKLKEVKKSSKNYSNGIATISVDSKENADAIWQAVPKALRSPFKMIQISDTDIIVEASFE